ncbi:MAG TPA: RNA polymerase sigma factor SigB [Bacillota bacterium]|nr:RNA polymerase sigma factor SigB [Bacillota bacterium]
MTKFPNKRTEHSEVYEWIEQIQQNPENNAAKEHIVLKYTNLVHALARKYAYNKQIQEDLVQVGMIGLLEAVRRFDATYGRKFESYAIPTIIGEIKRYIRDKTWSVHVPRRIKELGPQIKRAVDELTIQNQSSPSIFQIAQHLNASEEEVLETMEMRQSYRALSVDHTINSDSEGRDISLLDLIGDSESGYDSIDFKVLIEKLLPILPEREQQIIQYTFFENKNQKETGELLGISQMHVSRLQRRSLRKLREALPNNLFDFME